MPNEAVDHPAHYGGDTTYEAIKVIEARKLGFCLGNRAYLFRQQGNKLISAGNSLEQKMEFDLGITSDFRDPGFPCYKIEGVEGYFYTPRQAIESLAKQEGK